MNIDQQYKGLIHENWTALLRPKTGLKDMFIELAPGHGPSPVAKPGYTIPVANTLPDIDVDEILSSLDADSRAYLQLLINGAGAGLAGKGGSQLAQVLMRYEPTHRDLARINSAVALRGADLRQLVNSLQRLNTALATKQGQIIQLVDSSAKVFRAFASEDGHISHALVLLPGTLSQTTATLQKVQAFAQLLGPTSTNLLPAAHALPAANAALVALAKPSTPIVQNQIRPFVIAAQPLVKQLQPAAANLATATPNLNKTFGVVNHLGNMLGYNPGNTEHGYLWWLAWLNHEVRTLFSIQDANGVFRPIFLQLSCASMTQVSNGLSGSELLLNLTPILSDATLCPPQSTASGLLAPLSKRPPTSRATNGGPAGSPGSGSTSTSSASTNPTNSGSTSTPSGASNSASSNSPSANSASANSASSNPTPSNNPTSKNAANSALNSILTR
jgi:phospholipid/cholesterol/gamma-HCH transport system substrate-binding protein